MAPPANAMAGDAPGCDWGRLMTAAQGGDVDALQDTSRRPYTGPWFAGIARYKGIDKLPRLKVETVQLLDGTVGIPDHGEAVIAAIMFSRLLVELKPAQAEAIRLVKLEGYTMMEAFEAMGQSASLVKVNIHRGLSRLASIARKAGDAV